MNSDAAADSSAAAPGSTDTHATRVRRATATDAGAVRALLRNAQLPIDGVPDDLAHFLVAQLGEMVVGAIGLEPYGDSALLRSAVVAPAVRGTGIGDQLVKALIDNARSAGARHLILLTTTAEGWFPRFGFERIERGEVPAAVHASAAFRGACPDSAIVMRVEL